MLANVLAISNGLDVCASMSHKKPNKCFTCAGEPASTWHWTVCVHISTYMGHHIQHANHPTQISQNDAIHNDFKFLFVYLFTLFFSLFARCFAGLKLPLRLFLRPFSHTQMRFGALHSVQIYTRTHRLLINCKMHQTNRLNGARVK